MAPGNSVWSQEVRGPRSCGGAPECTDRQAGAEHGGLSLGPRPALGFQEQPVTIPKGGGGSLVD